MKECGNLECSVTINDNNETVFGYGGYNKKGNWNISCSTCKEASIINRKIRILYAAIEILWEQPEDQAYKDSSPDKKKKFLDNIHTAMDILGALKDNYKIKVKEIINKSLIDL